MKTRALFANPLLICSLITLAGCSTVDDSESAEDNTPEAAAVTSQEPKLLASGCYDATSLNEETLHTLPEGAQIEFADGIVMTVPELAELGAQVKEEMKYQRLAALQQMREELQTALEAEQLGNLQRENAAVMAQFAELSPGEEPVTPLAAPGVEIITPTLPGSGGLIVKQLTKIASSDVTTDYNVGKAVSAMLTNADGLALPGQKITLSFDGVPLTTLTTDRGGRVSYVISGQIAAGAHSMTWQFAGSDSLLGVSKTNKFTVTCVGAPPTLKSTTGTVTPSGALILSGTCFGPPQGEVRLYAAGLPNGFVSLVMDQWTDSAVATFLPPITGVAAGDVKLKVVRKDAIHSNELIRPFVPTQEVKMLTKSDFAPNSCADAPIFVDKCYTKGENGCKSTICADHHMPVIGYGGFSDRYKITLKNGYQYASHAFDPSWWFGPPNPALWADPAAGYWFVINAPIGASDPELTVHSKSSTIDMEVPINGATWYAKAYTLDIFVKGPAGVSYK